MEKIFLSYSGKDGVFAHLLASALNKRGVEALINKEEILWGQNLIKTTQKALKSASAVIVLLSENSRDSKWISFEIGAATAQGKTIFPILISESPDIIPPHLQHVEFIQRKDMSAKEIADIIVKQMKEEET